MNCVARMMTSSWTMSTASGPRASLLCAASATVVVAPLVANHVSPSCRIAAIAPTESAMTIV